jgi:E2/UBC family protein E
MTPIEQQFEVLKNYLPKVELKELPDKSHLIVVSDVELPTGWSKSLVQVKFIAPVGYPLATPDCFWTDADLRLAVNQGVPKNTGSTPIPHVGGQHLWFSWHVKSWNPNSDSLLTYFYVVKRRLQEPQ